MANYLQRIADSGSRTSSVAKPPAAARGLMPPIAPLPRLAFGDDAPHHLDVSSAPPISAPDSILEEAEAGLTEPSPREAQHNEIDAGKPAPTPMPVQLRVGPESPPSRAVVRAPEGLRSSAPGTTRERSIHKVAEETTRTFIPRTLLNRTASESSEQPAKRISPPITHPIRVEQRSSSLDPIVPTTHAPSSPAQEDARGSVPPVTLQPAKSVDEVALVNRPTPQVAQGDVHEHFGESRLPIASEEADLKASAIKMHLPEIPATETRRPEVMPTSAPQVARPPAQSPEPRRRTQISIGKIDVQVNNQAAQPATPQPSRVAARMNALEQHYLGRFFFNL